MKKPLNSLSSNDTISNSQSLIHNHSRNGRKSSGCITSILRRILCLTSSPLDHIKYEEKTTNYSLVEEGNSTNSTPSIVARLMGLEPVPQIEDQSPSIKKSIRSPKAKRYQKIIPMYQELEDENFFILSFDHQDHGDGIEFSLKQRKKRRKKKKSEGLLENWNKENGVNEDDLNKIIVHGRGRKDGNCLVLMDISNQKSHKRGKKMVKQQDMVKLENNEISSDNSSPNSVLDFAEFPPDNVESPNQGNSNSRLENTKLRRTLCEVLKSLEKPEEEKRSIKDECEEEIHIKVRQRNRKHKIYCVEDKWEDLAANEMEKMSWLDKKLSKNRQFFEEIGRDLASEILDQLLDELAKF